LERGYDVAVIGGGPAGYVAAIKAAQLGGSVVLFEKDSVGGACLNRGCIPTKTYLKTAEYIHGIQKAGERGVKLASTDLSIDMGKVVKYKNGIVKKLTSGVAGLLKSHGVHTVKGTGTLDADGNVSCEGQVYCAKNVILCGGSKTGTLSILGADTCPDIITSDGILELTELPKKLVIIGGGVIGCEMACAFAAFGSQVSVVELAECLVPFMDNDISDQLKKALEGQGVQVLLSAKVSKIGYSKGKTAVFVEGVKDPLSADKILLSFGRAADLECLGELQEKILVTNGKVEVDEQMRTNIPNIFAAGDINGLSMLAHAAFKMGETAAANAMGRNEKCDLTRVPICLYTLPEAASVGRSQARAAASREVLVGRFPFSANGRTLAGGEENGFVKVVVSKEFGEILGVHIFGGAATEMIAEAVTAMSMEVTAHEIAGIIHAHPTFSEAFMEACADALGQCVHLPPPK